MNIFDKAKRVVYDLASGDKDMMRMSIPVDKDDDDIVLIGTITAGERLAKLLQEAGPYLSALHAYDLYNDDELGRLNSDIFATLHEIGMNQ